MDDEDVPAYLDRLGLPGIVDTHVHFIPDRVQDAIWRWFDGLDPAWPVTYRFPAPERLATLRQLRVRHHTALAYAHRPGMLRFLNDHTMGLAEVEPSVIPTFTIYPEPGVAEETARCLANGGSCVKVHLQVGAFDATDALLEGAWEQIEQAAVPVVLHAGAVEDGTGNEEWCGPEPVRRLLARFPGLQLIIAHLGAPDFEEFVGIAETHPNVRFDTAMVFTEPPYLSRLPDDLVGRLGQLGDRVLFGSDFPTIPQNFSAQIDGLAALGLGDEWMRKVLWYNGSELFGVGSDRVATGT